MTSDVLVFWLMKSRVNQSPFIDYITTARDDFVYDVTSSIFPYLFDNSSNSLEDFSTGARDHATALYGFSLF